VSAWNADQLTPRAREIVGAALELVEEEGLDALSMRHLADRLGIRAASIYKHLPNRDALEAAVISLGFDLQASVFERAAEEGPEALPAIAGAYRRFAKEHPHLYRLMTERPLNRQLLASGVEQRGAAPVIAAAGGDRDLARAVWAFAHGMTILELNRRFPEGADLDDAWTEGVRAFQARAAEIDSPAG
jgi:AcrR family transcriptional regulator